MYNGDNIMRTYIKDKSETLKQHFAIERIKYDEKEVKHMQSKAKELIVTVVTIILSYIVYTGIKAALNFEYTHTPFHDGLDIKLLLDFGLYAIVFTVIYYLMSRLLSKLSQ